MALTAGATDPGSSHTEDQPYYVVQGKANIRVAGERGPVVARSVVYAKRKADRRSHSIPGHLRVRLSFMLPEHFLR